MRIYYLIGSDSAVLVGDSVECECNVLSERLYLGFCAADIGRGEIDVSNLYLLVPLHRVSGLITDDDRSGGDNGVLGNLKFSFRAPCLSAVEGVKHPSAVVRRGNGDGDRFVRPFSRRNINRRYHRRGLVLPHGKESVRRIFLIGIARLVIGSFRLCRVRPAEEGVALSYRNGGGDRHIHVPPLVDRRRSLAGAAVCIEGDRVEVTAYVLGIHTAAVSAEGRPAS